MDRKVAIIAIVLIVILALLLKGRGDTLIINEADGGDIILKGGDVTNYEVPPLTLPDTFPGYKGGWFDWLNTTNMMCGCDLGYKSQILLESPPPPPLALPPAPPFVMVQAPPPSVYTYQPLPASPIVQASRPTYTWGWEGLSRVIRLSNGVVLKTGLSNRKFTQNDDGTITYAGFKYWPG